MHPVALFAAALLATAQAPAPPPALAPYVHGDRFDPGDYRWLRGRFADASPADKAAWKALWAWRERCRAAQFAAIRAELASRGVHPTDSIEQSNGVGLCGSFGYALPQGDTGQSWPAFQAAVARALPVAKAVIWSAALAQAATDPDTPDLASDLIARPTTDQLLRRATSWDDGEVAGAPPLDPAALGIVRGRIWLAISERDAANTAWLKTIVATRGWPTITAVGKDPAHMAWLLVQHADDDPVFQLEALRRMEPLAVRGEVAKKDYAYLYDRVMLKLAGKQRYGSQFTCTQGLHTPLPLEDPAHVDALRRGMGMDSVADNVARMTKVYGPCPADPVGAAPAGH